LPLALQPLRDAICDWIDVFLRKVKLQKSSKSIPLLFIQKHFQSVNFNIKNIGFFLEIFCFDQHIFGDKISKAPFETSLIKKSEIYDKLL
jgi:hypothetical protein